MEHDNPYASGVVETPSVSPSLIRLVATRLKQQRMQPPTVLSLLFAWRAFPRLFASGLICVAALTFLSRLSNGISSHWPVGMLGIFLGAALRDIGITLRVVRYWPAQRQLIDWEKVEQFAE